MNKLRYEKPFAEIVEFDTSDVVVVASGDSGGDSGNKKQQCFISWRDGEGYGFFCGFPLSDTGLINL